MSKSNLLEKVYSLLNLEGAWDSINKTNKKSHGLSQETIEEFSANLKSNIRTIRNLLKEKKYSFSKLRAVRIPKRGNSGGYRPLRIPEVRDRIVMKAMVRKIEPIFIKNFNLNNDVSYAYRKRIGVREAIWRMESLYKGGYKTILQCDIEKFFDSVNREILLKKYIFPNLPDDSINTLIADALEQEIGNRDDFNCDEWMIFENSQGGIPQGGTLSPLFANVYLAPFDREMISLGYKLIRYADDFVVMCYDEKQAHDAYEHASNLLKGLELSVYPLNDDPQSKSRIVNPHKEDAKFLSICFNGDVTYPSKDKLDGLKVKIRDVTDPQKNQNIITILTRCRNLVKGWMAAFSYTSVDRYCAEIDMFVNQQLAYSLRSKKWKLRKLSKTQNNVDCLNIDQRRSSGIPVCADILKSLRQGDTDN
ncbi:MAG: reverse transcriptase domain-containing protein [Bacteroidota bacterium]